MITNSVHPDELIYLHEDVFQEFVCNYINSVSKGEDFSYGCTSVPSELNYTLDALFMSAGNTHSTIRSKNFCFSILRYIVEQELDLSRYPIEMLMEYLDLEYDLLSIKENMAFYQLLE